MRTKWLALAAGVGTVALGLALYSPGPAQAVIPEVGQASQSNSTVDRLADPKRSAAALDELVRRRDVKTLAQVAESSVDMSARGWAVVGLAKVGGNKAADALLELQSNASHPTLVRTWAAAARVGAAEDLDALRQLAQQRHSFPGLERPLRMQVEALAGSASTEELLALSIDGTFAPIVAPLVMQRADEADLVRLMRRHPEDAVRRQATAFAATMATDNPRSTEVPRLVLDSLALPRRLGDVPWKGGALYVPGLTWGKAESKELVRTLIGWWLLLHANERSSELNQVWNNLYSISLLQRAGYDRSLSANPDQLVRALAKVEGKGNARELLNRIGLAERYGQALR
ncbi:MAG: hypothetical protein KTR31_28170 [Myxococcales bacterium]|nr:hypothetical protein [Myxococcales bacterium]